MNRFSSICAVAPTIGAVFLSSCNSTSPPVATTLSAKAGDNQTAIAGAAVAVSPSVIVRDGSGNPFAGVSVAFSVGSGGGAITGPAQTTGADGIASLGSWTLGTTAGTNTVIASVTGLAGSPLTFTATGTAGPPSTITKVLGDGQSAVVGTEVATNPNVKVTDANGNVVSGVPVTFAVATGGGSITAGTQATTSSGLATVGTWKLGCTLGTQTLTAAATGLAAVTFAAQGTAAPAVTTVAVAPISFGMIIGDTVTLTATGRDANTALVPCTTTIWGNPSTSGVTVSAGGLVTAISRGFVTVPATISSVTGASTMSVYSTALLDSVSFILTSAGQRSGWTESSLAVGVSKCVQLITYDANNLTSALRWIPAISDSAVVAVTRQTALPHAHCFRALKPGSVTVFGTFGGKTAQKTLIVP